MANGHARLSASKNNMWINCVASLAAEEACGPERTTSKRAANQGTAAHYIAAECLKGEGGPTGYRDPRDYLGRVVYVMPDGGCSLLRSGAKVKDENAHFKVDEEMCSAIDVYLEHCAELKSRYEASEEHIEVTLDALQKLHPELGGTSDHMLLVPFEVLHVSDYKHGYGVVEVEGNTQARQYGVGALEQFDAWDDVDAVHIHIVQPRAPHADGPVRTEVIKVAELKKWRDEKLVPSAIAADKHDGDVLDRAPGDHCKWCRAAPTCPALVNQALTGAAADFAEGLEPDASEEDMKSAAALEVREMPADDLAAYALKVPMIDAFVRAVEAEVKARLEAGIPVLGHKLVTGRSPGRDWTDEEKAQEKAKKLARSKGKKTGDLFKPQEFKSVAQVEKVFGKATFEAEFADLVAKAPGKPTVALASDPRPPIAASAVSDFEDAPELDELMAPSKGLTAEDFDADEDDF